MTGHATRPRKAGKPIWPKVSAGFVRSVLAGHSALGLAFAALIYLVCFSGTVAVFVHEFERWENPTTPRLHAIEPEAVQRALVSAQDAFGQPAEHIYMRLPAPESPHFTITADIGHGKVEETWFVDGSGGLAGKDEAAWTRFMTDLHM